VSQLQVGGERGDAAVSLRIVPRMSGDLPNPLIRSDDPQALVLSRPSDRATLVWAYAESLLREASFDLSVAMQLRCPATPGVTSRDLGSSMKKEALEQRKERRAAIKSAAECVAAAIATARFAREVEKDVGETIDIKQAEQTPLDPATAALQAREKRDKEERRRRFAESAARARSEITDEQKAGDEPVAGEPEPLPASP
jgi:hypothetical protein